MKLTCLLLFTFLPFCIISAQQQANTDSLNTRDSARLTQEVILQQQQRKVDSLVKVQLELQLQQATVNSQESKELAEQLKALSKADSLRKANQLEKIKALKQTSKGFPVVPFTDTLFYVYTPVGSVNPSERAQLITSKIQGLYNNDFFKADSLRVVVNDNEADVIYNDLSILAISDFDALWYGSTKEAIATDYLYRIRNAIAQERETYSLFNWLKRIALVVLTLLILALIIYIINKLFKKGIALLASRRKAYFTGWRIKNAEILQPDQQFRFVVSALNVLRMFVVLLALYLSLPIIFSVFPETKEYTETLLGWIIRPVKSILESLLAFMPNLFTIIVVYFFTKLMIKAVSYFAKQIESGNIELPGFHKDFTKPTYNIIRFLLYAFMLVIIFPYLPGHESPAFQGISVFLGVLLSFGSSSAFPISLPG